MAVEPTRRQVAGIPMKHITLLALVIQNAALVLLMRYSRTMPLVYGDRYFASTAVFLSEMIKFSFFLSVALYEIATSPQTPDTSTIGELSGALSRAVFTGDSWKLAIPAVLYALQNILQYTAASNLDAATFAVTYQLKIVSTAMFGIFLLGRTLNGRKWMSLGLMAFGIAIVQMSSVSQQGRVLSIKDLRDGVSFNSPRSIWEMEDEGNRAAGQLNKRSATYEGIDEDRSAANPRMNVTIGLAAAVVACVLSGMAGVYFEKILRTRSECRASVWVRNVQLSFYTLWPVLFLGVLFTDGEHLEKTGFFTGYNWIVWLVVVLQAVGGILVALAMNYSDSMTKSFASSASTVITFLVSAMFMDFNSSMLVGGETLTLVQHVLGTVATLFAAILYNTSDDDKKTRPPPISITQYEKSGDAKSYFDLEAVATPAAKSPLREPMRDALSTSRPGTPVSERRHLRSKSTERRFMI
ncbi:hypothetical protein AC578_8868 [Pseudocercospora eumusae]|uniref:EamA domain-containing protein n=1 Tax=Pseudocercospora eumusae TaxID=321146 RepID=A0A139HBI4_9PEZI|nr:hypothetical protein AC578_8868 [Pseudocercospora eumusae]